MTSSRVAQLDVIPAQAGIQSGVSEALDSRLRGNDEDCPEALDSRLRGNDEDCPEALDSRLRGNDEGKP